MLTMQSWQLGLALRMEWTTGLLRTHGELTGVTKDSSRFKEVSICVELLTAMHTLKMYLMPPLNPKKYSYNEET